MWYNGEIPARLFFEILKTENLNLLKKDKDKKVKRKQLKKNWNQIYDEYFELKDDQKMKIIIQTQKDIISLATTIELVKQALYVIVSKKLDDNQIKVLSEKIKLLNFPFDENNPLESAHSLITEYIPSLQTRIEFEKENLKSLTEGQASTFEDNCVAFESYGYSVNENCSLRRYIAYEKAVLKRAKENGKRKTN